MLVIGANRQNPLMMKMKFYWPWPRNWATLSSTWAELRLPTCYSLHWKLLLLSRKPWFGTRCFNCSKTHLNSKFKAIESAGKVVQFMTPQHIEDYYLPMLKRLTSGDWFTSRTSACGMYAPSYPLCSEKVQEELRK